jgi:hypothetical protein
MTGIYDRPTAREVREQRAEEQGRSGTTAAKPKTWTSIEQGKPIPAAWGTLRLPAIILSRGTPVPCQVGGKLTDITYGGPFHDGMVAPAVLGFCLTPAAEAVAIYRGSESVFASIHSGGPSGVGATYSWALTGSPGVVRYITDRLALDDSGRTPEISAELRCRRVIVGGDPDALPHEVATDLVTLPKSDGGLGLDAGQVQVTTGLDNTAASSFERWCAAAGFRVSGAAGPETKRETLESLAASTFSVVVHSRDKVKFVPLAGGSLTANGATYTPPPPTAITSGDIRNLVVDRIPDDEVVNRVWVRFNDRSTGYESRLVEYKDEAHASQYGDRDGDEIDAPWITTAERAHALAQLIVRRSVYERATARFEMDPRYGAVLEPGDLLSVQDGVALTTPLVVRIETLDHLADGWLEVETREVVADACQAIPLVPEPASPTLPPVWSLAATRADADLDNVDLGGGNLMRNSSFEVDSDADGMSDYWAVYSSVDSQTVTPSRVAGGLFGGVAQKIAWSNPNTWTKGIRADTGNGSGVAGGWVSGRWYTVGVAATGNLSGGSAAHRIGMGWNNPPDEVEVVECPDLVSLGDFAFWIYRVRWTTSPVEANGALYLTLTGSADGTHTVDGATGWLAFDAAAVYEGRVWPGYAPRGEETAVDASIRSRSGIARPTEDVVYWRGMSTGAPVLMDPLWVAGAEYLPGARALSQNGSVYVCHLGIPNSQSWPQNDPSHFTLVGTAASQERLQFTNQYARNPSTGTWVYKFKITLQPRTDADNLDALGDLKLDFYSASGGSAVENSVERMPSRRYLVPGTPDSTSNAVSITTDFSIASDLRNGGSNFGGYVRATLSNALGTASRDYGPAPSGTGVWAGGAAIPSAGNPPGDEGDPGGGGECPAPETPVLLPGGATTPAGLLAPDDYVWTLPEDGGGWGAFRVSHVSRSRSRRVRLVVRDGRELVVSPMHRVAVPGGWAHVVDLAAGERLADGGEVDRVEESGEGEVVRITVEGAHTYVAGGILSHNLKKLP